MRAIWVAAAAGAVALGGLGCEGPPSKRGPIAEVPSPQVPSYQDVARRYNERAAHFNQLWARTTVRMRYQDEQGRWQTEQGDDGHLLLVRPTHLALSTGKLGEPFFRLGSDGKRYWWFDLRKPRRAWVGSHASRAARGLDPESPIPIPPRDLIELLGITPLPTDDPGQVALGAGGELVVTVPADEGLRRLTLDPQTYEPRLIELFDRSGEPAVVADLSEYTPATVIGTAMRPRLPKYVTVRDPAGEGELRITLSDAKSEPGLPDRADAAFDFDRLVRAHGVKAENITDLDHAAPRLSGRDPGTAR